MDGGATASARWIGNDVSGKLTNCSSISVKSNIFKRGHSGNSTQLRKISVTEPNFNHRKKITIMSQNIRMIHLYDCDFTWWLASLSPWTIYPLIAALRKPHFERTFQLRRNEGKISSVEKRSTAFEILTSLSSNTLDESGTLIKLQRSFGSPNEWSHVSPCLTKKNGSF